MKDGIEKKDSDDLSCPVCGVRLRDLHPLARYVKADGSMHCTHSFGTPADPVAVKNHKREWVGTCDEAAP